MPTAAIRKLLSLTLPPLPINTRAQQLLLITTLIVIGLIIVWLPPVATLLLWGGVAFVGLLLVKPILSLYVLILLIPFSPLFAIPVAGINLGLMEITLALGVIAWLLQQASGQTFSSNGQPQAGVLLWPFLLFLGGVGLSWLNTLSIGASLVETLKWVEMLVLYLLVVALLPARQIKWVVATLLLAGMAQAGLGLYQFIYKVGPEGFLLFGGLFLRAYGTFAQPNPYAGYLGLVLPLSLALVIWGFVDFKPDAALARFFGSKSLAKPQTVNLALKIGLLALLSAPLGLLVAALFASQSRGAWLGFAVAAVVTFTAYSKKTAAMMALAGLAGAIVLLAGMLNLTLANFNTLPNVMTQRLVDALAIFTITDVTTIEVTDANFATVERLAHWQAAREMWRDHPWLGVGFGNYAVVYPAYAPGRWLNPLGHAHNYLLNVGAEAGLAGITVYLIFWIFTFSVLWVTIRRSHGFDKAVAAGALGIMVHLHIHNLFDNLYVQGMYLHVAVVLALASILFQTHARLNLTANLTTKPQLRKTLTDDPDHHQFLPNQP